MLCFLRLLAASPAPSAFRLPLPLASLLFRLHALASPCIGFCPLASPCILFASLHLPWGVGVSGCRVCSGCRVSGCRVCSGCRVSGCRVCSGCRVGSPLLPLPFPLPEAQRQRKQGIKHPAFFIQTLHSFVYDCKSSD